MNARRDSGSGSTRGDFAPGSTDDFTRVLAKLCAASRVDFANPYAGFAWPEAVDPAAWYMSPELVSLHGTDAWNRLDESGRRRLAFYEAVNFMSLNIHGERALLEGLSHRLHTPATGDVSDYLHHFVDEENKHMVYFAGFCLRYAGKIYPELSWTAPREFEPGEEEFLFYARVLLFEEIVDVYNARMARDTRLAPVARAINEMHHRDETRHLAFGRRQVSRLFERAAPSWKPETLAGVREHLAQYLTATWKSYYNPQAYRDAGLSDAFALREAAFEDPERRAQRTEISSPSLRALIACGVFEREPLA